MAVEFLFHPVETQKTPLEKPANTRERLKLRVKEWTGKAKELFGALRKVDSKQALGFMAILDEPKIADKLLIEPKTPTTTQEKTENTLKQVIGEPVAVDEIKPENNSVQKLAETQSDQERELIRTLEQQVLENPLQQEARSEDDKKLSKPTMQEDTETPSQPQPNKEDFNTEYAFNTSPTDAIQKVQRERMRTGGTEIFPCTSFVSNSNSIEGLQIDFISQADDLLVVTFKLTPPSFEDLTTLLDSSTEPNRVSESEYIFRDVQGRETPICGARTILLDQNITVRVSSGKASKKGVADTNYFGSLKEKNPLISMKRVVAIEIKGLTNPTEISQKIQAAFEELGIDDALQPPSEETQKTQKESRLRKQHRLADEENWLQYKQQYEERSGATISESLQYQEVLPGYVAIVDPNALTEYQKDGLVYLAHTSTGVGFTSILTNGLFSRHERFRRGVDQSGIPKTQDFESGGADSVFLGCFPSSNDLLDVIQWSPVTYIFKPEVLNRTDWFAYNKPEFGITEGKTFENRPSPQTYFQTLRENPTPNNEIMMPRGIPPEMMEYLLVTTEASRTKIINLLSEQGINNVGGKTLEEFILTQDSFQDTVLTHADTPSKTYAESLSPNDKLGKPAGDQEGNS